MPHRYRTALFSALHPVPTRRSLPKPTLHPLSIAHRPSRRCSYNRSGIYKTLPEFIIIVVDPVNGRHRSIGVLVLVLLMLLVLLSWWFHMVNGENSSIYRFIISCFQTNTRRTTNRRKRKMRHGNNTVLRHSNDITKTAKKILTLKMREADNG
jgi:hypothetical protein